MIISLLPASGVKLQAGDSSVLVDTPSTKRGGLILNTVTSLPINSFVGTGTIIRGPGEYEVDGIRIRGMALGGESGENVIRTAYSLIFDNINFGILGLISTFPEETVLDMLGEVDILLLSVDNKKLKGKELVTLIKQITPRMIIPTDDKTMKFLREELGQKVEVEEKLVIKKRDLIKEGVVNKLIWLKTK